MPLQVVQRPFWNGTSREMGGCSSSIRTAAKAKAVLLTHQLGWEVRLMIGAQLEVVQTKVCRTQETVVDSDLESVAISPDGLKVAFVSVSQGRS